MRKVRWSVKTVTITSRVLVVLRRLAKVISVLTAARTALNLLRRTRKWK